MPNPNVNRRNASDVRNVLGSVENLFNEEMVERVFEDGSIPSSKVIGGGGGGGNASDINNDSAAPGATVADALTLLDSGLGSLQASDIENDSGVTGNSVDEALDQLDSDIGGLQGSSVGNDSGVGGANVSAALDDLQFQITGTNAPPAGSTYIFPSPTPPLDTSQTWRNVNDGRMYMNDALTGAWISVEQFPLIFNRSGNFNTGAYLRIGNTTPTAFSGVGYFAPQVIRIEVATFTVRTTRDKPFEILVNGVAQAKNIPLNLNFNGEVVLNAGLPVINVGKGDFLQLQLGPGAGGNVRDAVVSLLCRWEYV